MRAEHELQQAVDAVVPHGVKMLLRDFAGEYEEQVAECLLGLVADGLTLRTACDLMGLLPRHARRWIATNDGGMTAKYQTALAMQAEAWADEMVGEIEQVPPEPGYVSRARLRFEVRKWLMGKNNLRFGDKSTVVHEGNPDKPVQTINRDMTPAEAQRAFVDTMRGEV